MERYLKKQVVEDLERKMVFVAGPRQVGKTTLAKSLITDSVQYLNWDIPTDRETILRREISTKGLVIFDEIHKYRGWRNYLKGLYDQHGSTLKILVTGSAKLDVYRYGGDSLQGRYHFLRLLTLSLAELPTKQGGLKRLFELGGFPEPFLSQEKKFANRWSKEYRSRLISEEISSLERISDLGKLELLSVILPERVGSPLSINSLREELEVSHKTLTRWLDILEKNYALFRIPPFTFKTLRAVKKEQKHYHFDWNLVVEEGPRFENLVACHLLKWICYEQDTKGRNLKLHYFRDVDRREVDFLISENRKPIQAIECRVQETEINPNLYYLKNKFSQLECFQISLNGTKQPFFKDGISVLPASTFLERLV